ncbi:MAG: TIGR01548 family HAD-type hydrolase [Planctomyces sp.]|nr:TIGR01548 family HAD-type hydrolase [Planctomyces sp.]
MSAADGLLPAARVAVAPEYKRRPAPQPIDLRLDANEGSPPDAAWLARALAGAGSVAQYPTAAELEAELAERWGVTPDRVVVTAGADDAIQRIVSGVIEPGRAAVITRPTFEMIDRDVMQAGGEVRAVPWMQGPLPVGAMLSRLDGRAALVCVVSPNNPTGAAAARAELAQLWAGTARAPVVRLLDAAYAEFADDDATAWAIEQPATVVTRTFSKAWGLAGLRVGYAVGDARVIGWMRRIGQPYAVARTSIAVALAAHRERRAATEATARAVRAQRASLAGVLTGLGAQVVPSEANFVLARPGGRGALVAQLLAGLGIAVRRYDGHPELDGWLRIGCPGGAPEVGARVERALRAAIAPEALLLDMDGVIVDVSGSYRAAIALTAESFGVRVTPEDVRAAKAAGNANNDWTLTHRLVAAALGRAQGVPTLAEVTERFERLYQGENGVAGLRHRESMLIDRGALEGWAARMKLAVVTGRPRADAERLIRERGLEGLFGAVVCMEDAPVKPDPAPVELALRRLGVSSAWMVGDTVDDVAAARAAGVVPVGCVAPGEAPERARAVLLGAGAGVVIDRLGELREILP